MATAECIRGRINVRRLFVLVIIFASSWVLRDFPVNDDLEEQLHSSSSLTYYSSSSQRHNSLSIRRWGCRRNETPLIFVHIGKAGGGQIRARFAAATLHFDPSVKWTQSDQFDHYFPLPGDEKARFCNSKNRNHRYDDSEWSPKTYEGNLPCNATTPLGNALACPNAFAERRHTCRGCSPTGKNCHTVYVGHNLMGSEFHWLPAMFLQKWWNDTGQALFTKSHPESMATLNQGFEALLPSSGAKWCSWKNVHRPIWEEGIKAHHKMCGAPLAAIMDAAFHQQYNKADYSPWYASLPLHRVILMRDPWTWLVSKFFWHEEMQKYTDSQGREQNLQCNDLSRVNEVVSPRGGWANTYLLTYLVYLCGDDCEQRLEKGLMTVQEAEIQATGNLRSSFSVVGILEDTKTFLAMVSARIAYVNMSLNPDIEGSRHGSKRVQESIGCNKIFKEPSFQTKFRKAVPLVTTLERLYHLAMLVNRVQQEELKECMSI